MKATLFNVTGYAQQGLNSDLPAVDLPAGFITYGNNFRMEKGAYQSVYGADEMIASIASFTPGHIFPYTRDDIQFIVACGRSHVKAYNGTSWTGIDSVAGYSIAAGGEYYWNSCLLGNIPIINNPSHVPEYWSPQSVSQVMQPLDFDAGNTWSAMSYKCRVMRSHGNYLFALNMTESAVEMPDTFRWSHPADVNGLPFTWDETDLSAVAGKAAVGGDSGRLLDGLTLKGGFVLYSDFAINVLYPDALFVWRKEQAVSGVGILATNCVCEVNGVHYFISKDDLCVFNGNQVKSIAENRIRKMFIDRTNFNYKDLCHVFSNYKHKEVWFCVPADNNTTPSLAFVYNWEDGSWGIRDLPSGVARMCIGFKVVASNVWSAMPDAWSIVNDVWSQDAYVDTLPIGILNSNGATYSLDDEEAAVDAASTIIRSNLPIQGVEGVNTITRLYPKVHGDGAFNIAIGSQDFIDAPIRWQDPVTFDSTTDRSIPVRTTGALHAYRIESIGSGTWKIAGLDIEYSPSGIR